MRGLTLIRPWPWVILDLPEPLAKRIENRPQRAPAALIGELIALHAGKTFDYAARQSIFEIAGVPVADGAEHHPTGIVGVCRLVDCLDGSELWSKARARELDQVRWFFGPYGYVLADVRKLARPVPCRGMQGFWPLPPAVEAEVMRQYEAAREQA